MREQITSLENLKGGAVIEAYEHAFAELLGNILDPNTKATEKRQIVLTVADDGITQQITVKTGIARIGDTELKSTLELKPYRTFREIDQPKSLFLLRLQSGKELPTAALFEADGSSWQLEAIASIKEWLASNIPDVKIIG